MKKLFIALGLVAATSAGSAFADTTTFTINLDGNGFDQYFAIDPSLDNSFTVGVAGLSADISQLGMSILDATGTTTIFTANAGAPKNGTLSVSFNDIRNSSVTLLASANYLLHVTGVSKNAGGEGTLVLNSFNGTVAPPVPEPGELGLLLSGFGLMAFIARRRMKNAA